MSEKKVLSFEELAEEGNVVTDTVPFGKGELKLASLNSEDMIEWHQDNLDEEKKKLSGFRLLIKSIVDEAGNRIPKERHDEFLAMFRGKDANVIRRAVSKALELNGMRLKTDPANAKNDSGETNTDASPTN